MKISPELLHLQDGVSWQDEFGLDPQQLEKLLAKPCIRLLQTLSATGVYINLFDKRDACDFFLGESLECGNLFHKLYANRANNARFEWFTSESNNPNMDMLSEKSQHLDISFALVIVIKNTEHNISGYAVFYGKKRPAFWAQLDPILLSFQEQILDKLILQKYKRLNQDQKELQSLIADTQAHCIFAKDYDSNIVYANDKFMSYYPPEMQDKVIGFTTVEDYDEKQRELFLQDDKEAFKQGVKVAIETIDFPSGERKTLETTKQRFTTNAGKDYILGFSYDVSHQYELIHQLQIKNADLDQVANMLATDLRAPANAMLKLLNWLQEDLAHIDNEDIHDNLQQLSQRTIRINKLLAALYQYCFAGRDKHRNSTIVLTTLVADILSELQPERNIETAIDDVKLELPLAPFQTVLKALISNVIDHNRAELTHLSVEHSSTKDKQIVSVSDNGKGIELNNQEQMFKLFCSTKATDGSHAFGLGLALARKVVESYEGTLHFDSQYTQGTRFVITWPVG